MFFPKQNNLFQKLIQPKNYDVITSKLPIIKLRRPRIWIINGTTMKTMKTREAISPNRHSTTDSMARKEAMTNGDSSSTRLFITKGPINGDTSLRYSVLYKIYDYTKNYTKSTIFYTNYMLYEDAITVRVLRRISFSVFLRRFCRIFAKEVFGNYEIFMLNFK